jgi:hypothetical protein
MLGEHTDEILIELGRGGDVEKLRSDSIVF